MRTNPIRRLTFVVTFVAMLMLLGGSARADEFPIATVVPGHVFVVRGFSVRSGDWLALEPSFLFTPSLVGPSRPIIFVARPMLGIGGSGVGIGLATTSKPPCPDVEACTTTPFFWLPVSLEARVERMYGPSHWRHAIYAGPTLSLSAYVYKASVGWMVDASDQTDRHVQIAIGGGF